MLSHERQRWVFDGDSYRCCPMKDGDGLLMGTVTDVVP